MCAPGAIPISTACAIGSGSLVGSWMNDSGFWIYTKMSGLTEAESLQTWTPLLAVLGSVFLMAASIPGYFLLLNAVFGLAVYGLTLGLHLSAWDMVKSAVLLPTAAGLSLSPTFCVLE